MTGERIRVNAIRKKKKINKIKKISNCCETIEMEEISYLARAFSIYSMLQ